MKKIRYLVYHEIIEIYQEGIEKFGGFGAIRDNDSLLSCVVNPRRIFAGNDLYPTLAEKAGILVFSLLKNHPFVDGNKRTAFVAGRIFLRLNGYDVKSLDEYESLIWKIARSEATRDDVFDWFRLSIRTCDEIEEKRGEVNESEKHFPM